jgi:hypothetical protein
VLKADNQAAGNEEASVNRLAEFFPTAIRIRIPVRVTAYDQAGDDASSAPAEETVIEFGTAREVLFVSALPLEFDDTVRLKNTDGSFDAQGSVVAVQVGERRSAVAVRFSGKVNNWIIQPA